MDRSNLSEITKLMRDMSEERPSFVQQLIYALLHHDQDVMYRVVEVMEDNYASELREIVQAFQNDEFEEDLQEGYNESDYDEQDEYGAMYEHPFMDHDLDIDRDFHLILENPEAFHLLVYFILMNPEIDPHLMELAPHLSLDHYNEPTGLEPTPYHDE